MAVTFTITAPGTDLDITQTYYAYLRRESDGLYWDADDDSFKAFGSLVDGTLDFVEDGDQPGLWELTVGVGAGDTGTYLMLPRDGLTDLLVTDEVETVYLADGARTLDNERDKVLLSHHHATYDAFQLLDEHGDPVEGATVRVFLKADYDAGDTDVAIGMTQTDNLGRWVSAVPVPRSATYVVHFHKDGVIGPTDVEIIVP